MTISPIAPVTLPPSLGVVRPGEASAPGAFQAVMSSAVDTVNSLQNNAHTTIQSFLSGEGAELHQVAMAQQQASLSFDLFLQVRNKAVQAYQEVMRMQL